MWKMHLCNVKKKAHKTIWLFTILIFGEHKTIMKFWNLYVSLMKFWYFDEIIPVTPFSVQISNTDELWSKYNNIVKCTNIFFKFFIQYFVHALYELMKYNMVNSIPNSTSGIRKQIFKLKDFHQGRGERICLNFAFMLEYFLKRKY